MLIVIENQLVIDFVRENDEIMFSRDIRNLLLSILRAISAVVLFGLISNNGAGAGCYLFGVIKIGLPSVGFIQVIGVKADAEFRQDCRIEGIMRAGREDIFPYHLAR